MKYQIDERGHIRDDSGAALDENLAMRMLSTFEDLAQQNRLLREMLQSRTAAALKIAGALLKSEEGRKSDDIGGSMQFLGAMTDARGLLGLKRPSTPNRLNGREAGEVVDEAVRSFFEADIANLNPAGQGIELVPAAEGGVESSVPTSSSDKRRLPRKKP